MALFAGIDNEIAYKTTLYILHTYAQVIFSEDPPTILPKIRFKKLKSTLINISKTLQSFSKDKDPPRYELLTKVKLQLSEWQSYLTSLVPFCSIVQTLHTISSYQHLIDSYLHIILRMSRMNCEWCHTKLVDLSWPSMLENILYIRVPAAFVQHLLSQETVPDLTSEHLDILEASYNAVWRTLDASQKNNPS